MTFFMKVFPTNWYILSSALKALCNKWKVLYCEISRQDTLYMSVMFLKSSECNLIKFLDLSDFFVAKILSFKTSVKMWSPHALFDFLPPIKLRLDCQRMFSVEQMDKMSKFSTFKVFHNLLFFLRRYFFKNAKFYQKVTDFES